MGDVANVGVAVMIQHALRRIANAPSTAVSVARYVLQSAGFVLMTILSLPIDF